MITKTRALELLYNLYESNAWEDAKWLSNELSENEEDEDDSNNREVIFEAMGDVLDSIEKLMKE